MPTSITPTRRHLGCLALLALASAVLPVQAQPDTWPSRTIRIIVPWSPGVPADSAARVVAERLTGVLKQPVVVENRPGASGTVGYAEVLRAPADGYTLYVLSSASMVLPVLYPGRNLNYSKDLDPVAHLHWSYNALVVPADSRLTSVDGIVARAKAEPGKLTYASAGNGTPAYLAGEAFSKYAGIRTTHVPYVQMPNALTDLLGGRVDTMFLTTVAAIPQVNGGKLRALAVTSARRLPALPNVPTMAELGIPNFVFRSFETVTVRAGTPKPVVERLNREINRILTTPEVRDQIIASGWDLEPMGVEQITRTVATESERWIALGRELQIKPD